jgi:tetratricopeptide (TPR) repeat protein
MRFFTLILLLVFTFLTDLRADMFAGARALEKQGKHAEAAAQYEKILAQQQASSSVLFNLGNCYYESSNYGKAILAYERALLINPRADDVQKNLSLTRKAAFPNEAIDFPTGPLHTLSRSEWAVCIVACALVIGMSSIGASFFPRMRKSLIIVAVCSLVPVVIASVALQQRRGESQRGIVTASNSKLLLSPFVTAEEVAPCAPGTLVIIEQCKKDFTYVRLASGSSAGWMPSKNVEQIEIWKTGS